MIPYLITFAITILLTIYAEKLIKFNNKKRAFIIMGICVFILSFFAGIRSDDVGKDIGAYVIPPFKWAQNLNFLEYMPVGNLEKGYMIFVYIITLIFNDYHYILFALQAIVCSVVFIFAYKNRNYTSMTLVVFVYLMIFYNDTLTMMRQSVACALILMSLIALKQKKYINTVILYILAVSFHTTALISVLLYAIIFLDNTTKIDGNRKKWINIILFLGILMCTVVYQPILYLFTYNIPILPTKFYEYINSSYYNAEGLSISKSILLFKTIWICISYYMNKIKNDKQMRIYFKFLCIDMCIFMVSFKLPPIMRLGQYFTYPALLNIIPKIEEIFKGDENKKKYARLALIGFLIVFWWFTNILNGEGGGTYPYKSDIINQLF